MRTRLIKSYLYFRGLISDSQLKEKTLTMIRRFQERVESSPQDTLEANPNFGKWTGMEVAFHAVNTTKGILRTCEGLRAKQNVQDSDKSSAGRTRKVSREDLVALMRRVYEMTEKFDFKNVKTGTCAHPFFGQRDFHQWLVINLVHLERHYRQLNRVLAS